MIELSVLRYFSTSALRTRPPPLLPSSPAPHTSLQRHTKQNPILHILLASLLKAVNILAPRPPSHTHTHTVARLMPVLTLSNLADALVAVASGVLRGSGRQELAFKVNLAVRQGGGRRGGGG